MKDHPYLFAVVPGPVDHDACFNAAGFNDFDDSDDEWDQDLHTFIDHILKGLETMGNMSIRALDKPKYRRSLIERLMGKPELIATTTSSLFCVATDDQFNGAIIDFGTPSKCTLHISNGHPIIWLSCKEKNLIESTIGDIIEKLRFKKQDIDIDWSLL